MQDIVGQPSKGRFLSPVFLVIQSLVQRALYNALYQASQMFCFDYTVL